MIDLNELGRVYTIVDPNSGNSKKIQIILLETFLDLVGTYDEKEYEYFEEYLCETLGYITDGFVPTIAHVSWYARREGELNLVEAVKQAHIEGNALVIVETLPEIY